MLGKSLEKICDQQWMKIKVTDFTYIDNELALKDCCAILSASSILSVDTEFVRERTFYPQPGLIQVSDGKSIFLIDPSACGSLRIFFELLESPKIRIIMHSSSEDIELFYFMGCGVIQNLFDTQIAAAWLGMGMSLSLQKLVEHYNNIVIEKQLTRTDWLKRPLSDAQLEYAAIDVLYLNTICAEQEASLTEKGFFDFMLEDCDLRCEAKIIEDIDRFAYLKVKKANSLQDTALVRLYRLATWREQMARKYDKPRQHVIKDAQILSISLLGADSIEELIRNTEISSSIVKRFGSSIITLLKADVIENSSLVQPVINFRALPAAGKTLNVCRDILVGISLEENIPLEVLPSKRWLKQFLLNHAANWYPPPDGWNGWRKNLLCVPLSEAIKVNGFNQV